MNLLFANDRRGEYPPGWYAETRDAAPDATPLRGAARADVVVIGGGYTGLSAALHLAEAGVDVALVEAHRVGFGASGRNGGQVGSGQRLDVDDLEKLVGRDRSRALWDMAEEAKALTRDLAARSGVTFHPGVAHAFRKPAELDHARRMIDRLARDYGYDQISLHGADDFRAMVPAAGFCGGELDLGAGHLHPLNHALGMARLAVAAGARIYDRSWVHRIDHADRATGKTVVATEHGRITCDHVILALNGYAGGLSGKIAARVMPINNYIAVTEPLGDRAAQVLTRNIAVHDTRFVVNYWRMDGDRLIFGGGETLGYRFPRDIAAKVRKPLETLYPQLQGVRLTHAWGGTLAITMNRMPCFQRLAPNALSAAGFSGHGVALASLAGRQMAQAVMGQGAGFDLMASLPMPAFPGGAAFRWPMLVAGMTWFSLRDRLGI
ncbi:MAG: FAD-binding oxidoreductase [Paracoccus sp. (in: a-proteobacteria)]|uniref:NAD(P)/FAD-dependent oxidoreductase n=1 Tax=Paracoccus sp. TaxID=267 RepID=UPI0026E07171|nr:FAD-binding oxidoreductase [Paracoccus sp. (in: a-proteobacteria)]MDO5622234.1 FAD-binding oxidoreductase [Paracoccus sp. (in: a-proteobacteria)]